MNPILYHRLMQKLMREFPSPSPLQMLKYLKQEAPAQLREPGYDWQLLRGGHGGSGRRAAMVRDPEGELVSVAKAPYMARGMAENRAAREPYMEKILPTLQHSNDDATAIYVEPLVQSKYAASKRLAPLEGALRHTAYEGNMRQPWMSRGVQEELDKLGWSRLLDYGDPMLHDIAPRNVGFRVLPKPQEFEQLDLFGGGAPKAPVRQRLGDMLLLDEGVVAGQKILDPEVMLDTMDPREWADYLRRVSGARGFRRGGLAALSCQC